MRPSSNSGQWATAAVQSGQDLQQRPDLSRLTVDVDDARRLPTKGPDMFRSQKYRAEAAEYGERVKDSTDPRESRKLQKSQDRLAALADNEQGLADDYHDAVHVEEPNQLRGAALADEEERVLRCLGAAVIMQWDALPTTLQREIFDTAGSVGKLPETAELRGQIARFLDKHKNDANGSKR